MTPPSEGALAEAARLLGLAAVRVRPAPHPPHDPLEAGWFASPENLAEHVAERCGSARLESWFGFDRRWPVVEVGPLLLAPGLPAPVGRERVSAPDGSYRRTGDEVLRDAGGRERPVLTTGRGRTEPALDLIWFGTTERWAVRSGRLEAEDGVSRLQLPAARHVLECLLVRGRRIEASVLDGLGSPAQVPSTVEVRRTEALVGERWRDPVAVIGARVGVVRAVEKAGGVEARLESGRSARYEILPLADGWRAVRGDDGGVDRALSLTLDAGDVVATLELAEGVHPLAPGVRGRIAFDLLSDLVVVGR